ncbi:hypothetical protein [Comamonas aquatica]|uniref:hypothetical protein n=1 Tax=Comamonas aquatica TaxID=225991 RepID=UPI003CFC605F
MFCQSGSWKIAQGGGGKGMSGIWSAYKGMTTYCNIRNMGRNFFASVDDEGNLRLWVTNTQSGKTTISCTNTPSCGYSSTGEFVELNTYGVYGQVAGVDGGDAQTPYKYSCSKNFPA